MKGADFMNINTNIYKQYINSGGSYSNHTQKNFSVHEKKSEKKRDSLYFSSEAAFLKDNIKAIKSCAADIVGLASEERISAIKKSVKNGEYNISAQQVADSILNRWI